MTSSYWKYKPDLRADLQRTGADGTVVLRFDGRAPVTEAQVREPAAAEQRAARSSTWP